MNPLKKKVKSKKEFTDTTTFGAYYDATAHIKSLGYSVGSMAGDSPICCMKGDYHIAKWYNLTIKEQEESDALIVSNDFREGTVTILFY